MKSVKEKKERALGTKLFLKAERCSSHKCVMIRRPYRPGQHGQKRRRALSDYGNQLQEKQKIQIVYGLTNRQMRNVFRAHAGNPEKIVATFEKRLDRVVYLLGLATSPRIARQLVSHGHIIINEKKVNIPSYEVKQGDVIGVRSRSKGLELFSDISARLKKHEPPQWLKLDADKLQGICEGEPSEDAMLAFDINTVGQFYMR